MPEANKFRGWIIYDAQLDIQSATKHVLSFNNVADLEIMAVRDSHFVTGTDINGNLLVGMFAEITFFNQVDMLYGEKMRVGSFPVWFVAIDAGTDSPLMGTSFYKRRKAMRLYQRCEFVARRDVYGSTRFEGNYYHYQHWDGLHFTAPTPQMLEWQLLDAGIILV